MKLGTHNSMTYLPPKKWYLYPFRFIAKCQSKTIQEQYELGARMFDLRIKFDKKGTPEFRHGSMAFKGSVTKTLQFLNTKKVYVRLLLETKKSDIDQEEMFRIFCRDCQEYFPNIKFFCGRRKFDWKVVFEFKYKEPYIEQYVSSMQGSKIDDLWPWLYAKLHNKEHMQECDKRKWNLFDFIEIQ